MGILRLVPDAFQEHDKGSRLSPPVPFRFSSPSPPPLRLLRFLRPAQFEPYSPSCRADDKQRNSHMRISEPFHLNHCIICLDLPFFFTGTPLFGLGNRKLSQASWICS